MYKCILCTHNFYDVLFLLCCVIRMCFRVQIRLCNYNWSTEPNLHIFFFWVEWREEKFSKVSSKNTGFREFHCEKQLNLYTGLNFCKGYVQLPTPDFISVVQTALRLMLLICSGNRLRLCKASSRSNMDSVRYPWIPGAGNHSEQGKMIGIWGRTSCRCPLGIRRTSQSAKIVRWSYQLVSSNDFL